jgi:hypothetical protein
VLNLPVTKVEKARSYREAFGQGREGGQLELVLRLLTRRCDALTPSHLEKIRALHRAQLDALGAALLDFGSIAALDAWVRAH